MDFYKINEQCLQQLNNVAKYLVEIEVKGKSVSYLYHAGLTLEAVLQQLNEDNKQQENEEKVDEVEDG